SAVIAIGLFTFKEAGKAMDVFVKILGVLMLVLIVYVVVVSQPPLGEALYRTILPERIDALAIVTLVGGTVGGYITFAGAHRLIDAGITGPENIREVNRGAITGIGLTAIVRFLLFLAALGVISMSMPIDPANPPASVFRNAAGEMGFRLFGVVMWAAAITSVVGAAYTSVSFLKTLHSKIADRTNIFVILFIVVSTVTFLIIGRPVTILVWAGTINGLILPFGLALVLIAARKRGSIGEYRHPIVLEAAGWLVVVIMLVFSVMTLVSQLT
ncbi:MAG: divalent metal cation transporter, partial [Acidobacteria bacterium]|nr:divalent metal cation transporter [Acidobacteriota bacterium]